MEHGSSDFDDAAMASREANALRRVLTDRWSCRAFLPTPVNSSMLDAILRMALLTPSWCNTQPWHVELVSGRSLSDLRSRLRDAHTFDIPPTPDIAHPERYEGVYLNRRRAAGWGLYEAVGVGRGDRAASMREAGRNFDFFGAPHAAIISVPRSLGSYGAIDCGLFTQTFLLAAQAHGIQAIAQGAITSFASVLHEALSIPSNHDVVVSIAFGHGDPDHPANGFRTTREPLDALVTRHT